MTKYHPKVLEIRVLRTIWFLGPTRVHVTKSTPPIGSSVFVRLTVVSNRHRKRHTETERYTVNKR